jgi:hypothetical protein
MWRLNLFCAFFLWLGECQGQSCAGCGAMSGRKQSNRASMRAPRQGLVSQLSFQALLERGQQGVSAFPGLRLRHPSSAFGQFSLAREGKERSFSTWNFAKFKLVCKKSIVGEKT